jgi:hypothetical protein
MCCVCKFCVHLWLISLHHTCIATSSSYHTCTTPYLHHTIPAFLHHHTCMHIHITTPACIFTSPHLHCYDRFHTYLHCWLYPLSLRRGNRQLSLCRYMHACVCVCVCVWPCVHVCVCMFLCVFVCMWLGVICVAADSACGITHLCCCTIKHPKPLLAPEAACLRACLPAITS